MSESKRMEAIRWATAEKNYDPVWGKWHLIVPGAAFTECGQVVRLFEIDGSPQFGPVSKVNCKRCLRKIEKG